MSNEQETPPLRPGKIYLLRGGYLLRYQGPYGGVQNMPLGGAIVFRVEGDADSWVVPARHFEVTP